MLKEGQKASVRKILENIEDTVEIVLFVSKESQESQTQKDLMMEVLPLGKLKLETFQLGEDEAEKYGVDKAPAMLFKDRPNVRFYGLTTGHEFRALLDTIVLVGSGESGLGEDSKDRLASLDTETELLIFSTPTCPYCPMASVTGNRMAMENDKVTSITVEAQEFPELAQKYSVMSVPKVVINGGESFTGALPEKQFVQKVLEAI